ncbi:hypothetical protein BTVI_103858 [Pitangus sulphuratus]|nr:hypothetical protein BTVI_103858 [Pitangus sulphuratus]
MLHWCPAVLVLTVQGHVALAMAPVDMGTTCLPKTTETQGLAEGMETPERGLELGRVDGVRSVQRIRVAEWFGWKETSKLILFQALPWGLLHSSER